MNWKRCVRKWFWWNLRYCTGCCGGSVQLIPSRCCHHFLFCLAAIAVVLLNCSGASWSQTLLGTTLVNCMVWYTLQVSWVMLQEPGVGTLLWNPAARILGSLLPPPNVFSLTKWTPFSRSISDSLSTASFLRHWVGMGGCCDLLPYCNNTKKLCTYIANKRRHPIWGW